MFHLKIKDREGTPLKIGDIVEVSDGKRINFLCRVEWMGKERMLSPFHTFSFHSVRKIGDSLACIPDGAVQCDEPRFMCWYLENPEADTKAQDHPHYLMEWRKCERLLESCYEIEPAI